MRTVLLENCLDREPIGDLDQEDLSPMCVKAVDKPARVDQLSRLEHIRSVLLPYKEDRATRSPFPPYDQVAAERSDIEVTIG